MPQELLFPKRKPTEPLLQGLWQKAGWVLVVRAVRGPRNQGTLGTTGVSPAHGGPGGLAPGSWLPAPGGCSSEVMLWPQGHPEPGRLGVFSRAGCGGEEFSGLRGEQGERCV